MEVKLINKQGEKVTLQRGHVISYDIKARSVKITDGTSSLYWHRYEGHVGDDKQPAYYLAGHKQNFLDLVQLIGATHGFDIELADELGLSFRFV